MIGGVHFVKLNISTLLGEREDFVKYFFFVETAKRAKKPGNDYCAPLI